MNAFIKRWFKSRHEVIVDEDGLMNVLRILNDDQINTDLSIGECGWREGKMWYVRFNATGRQADAIMAKLKTGKFKEVLMITNTNSFVQVEKLI